MGSRVCFVFKLSKETLPVMTSFSRFLGCVVQSWSCSLHLNCAILLLLFNFFTKMLSTSWLYYCKCENFLPLHVRQSCVFLFSRNTSRVSAEVKVGLHFSHKMSSLQQVPSQAHNLLSVQKNRILGKCLCAKKRHFVRPNTETLFAPYKPQRRKV